GSIRWGRRWRWTRERFSRRRGCRGSICRGSGSGGWGIGGFTSPNLVLTFNQIRVVWVLSERGRETPSHQPERQHHVLRPQHLASKRQRHRRPPPTRPPPH